MFWYYLCSGARKSLKLANSSYHILSSCSFLRCWGLGHKATSWDCQHNPSHLNLLLSGCKGAALFSASEYQFQNQSDFISPNDGWSQECKISGGGPTESPSYILRHRHFMQDIDMVICKQHSDVFYPPTPQVRKLAPGINSNLLFQLGFYAWILDTMCWYNEHFCSDHILSLCQLWGWRSHTKAREQGFWP